MKKLREFAQSIRYLTNKTEIHRDEIRNLAIEMGVLDPPDEPGSDQRDSRAGWSLRSDAWRIKLNDELMELDNGDAFFFYVEGNYKIWRIGHAIKHMKLFILRHINGDTCKIDTNRWSLERAIKWTDKIVWSHSTVQKQYELFRSQLTKVEWEISFNNFENLLESEAAWAAQIKKDKTG